MHFLQSLFFNRFKFTSLYIEPFKIILTKIYKKKIVLNLIKLKTYFLNSDILTQIVTTKTSNRKLRILRVLNVSLLNIKTPVIHKKLIVREATKLISIQNTLISQEKENTKDNNNDIDPLNNLLKNIKGSSRLNIFNNRQKYLKSRLNIVNSIRNKTINGIRFEASGRLTRRLIAQRAVSKLKYIGTLKNVDSSYRGISSIIVRGNTRSNTQLTKLKSKRQIGSFGIKG